MPNTLHGTFNYISENRIPEDVEPTVTVLNPLKGLNLWRRKPGEGNILEQAEFSERYFNIESHMSEVDLLLRMDKSGRLQPHVRPVEIEREELPGYVHQPIPVDPEDLFNMRCFYARRNLLTTTDSQGLRMWQKARRAFNTFAPEDTEDVRRDQTALLMQQGAKTLTLDYYVPEALLNINQTHSSGISHFSVRGTSLQQLSGWETWYEEPGCVSSSSSDDASSPVRSYADPAASGGCSCGWCEGRLRGETPTKVYEALYWNAVDFADDDDDDGGHARPQRRPCFVRHVEAVCTGRRQDAWTLSNVLTVLAVLYTGSGLQLHRISECLSVLASTPADAAGIQEGVCRVLRSSIQSPNGLRHVFHRTKDSRPSSGRFSSRRMVMEYVARVCIRWIRRQRLPRFRKRRGRGGDGGLPSSLRRNEMCWETQRQMLFAMVETSFARRHRCNGKTKMNTGNGRRKSRRRTPLSEDMRRCLFQPNSKDRYHLTIPHLTPKTKPADTPLVNLRQYTHTSKTLTIRGCKTTVRSAGFGCRTVGIRLPLLHRNVYLRLGHDLPFDRIHHPRSTMVPKWGMNPPQWRRRLYYHHPKRTGKGPERKRRSRKVKRKCSEEPASSSSSGKRQRIVEPTPASKEPYRDLRATAAMPSQSTMCGLMCPDYPRITYLYLRTQRDALLLLRERLPVSSVCEIVLGYKSEVPVRIDEHGRLQPAGSPADLFASKLVVLHHPRPAGFSSIFETHSAIRMEMQRQVAAWVVSDAYRFCMEAKKKYPRRYRELHLARHLPPFHPLRGLPWSAFEDLHSLLIGRTPTTNTLTVTWDFTHEVLDPFLGSLPQQEGHLFMGIMKSVVGSPRCGTAG